MCARMSVSGSAGNVTHVGAPPLSGAGSAWSGPTFAAVSGSSPPFDAVGTLRNGGARR